MSHVIKVDFSKSPDTQNSARVIPLDPKAVRNRDKGRALKLVLSKCSDRQFLLDIFDRYDRLQIAASNFAFLLTEHFPDETERGLVASTLTRAAIACGHATNTYTDPFAKEREFLLALLEAGDEIDKWKVTAKSFVGDRTQTWSGVDMPITAWLKNHLFDSIEFERAEPPKTTLNMTYLLAFKLLPRQELEFLAPDLCKRSLMKTPPASE